MFMEIGAELQRTGLRRLLVIDHSHGVVPPEEQLRKLFVSVEGRSFADVRVAYVDARGTAISRMEVGEIMGREQGYECRVFDNEARAGLAALRRVNTDGRAGFSPFQAVAKSTAA